MLKSTLLKTGLPFLPSFGEMLSVFFAKTFTTLLPKVTIAAVSVSVLAMGTAQSVRATTINFDDLPGDSSSIPNGYQGFNWNNFGAYDGRDYPGSGYQSGVVSPKNAAYNRFGTPASIEGTPFDFNSAYLTAAWNNGLTVTVQGYLNGLLKDTKTVVLDTIAPTLVSFNFLGIDRLSFSSSGGINAGVGGDGTHFVMDNFTYDETAAVPEPFTVLGGVVALGAGAAMKRKQMKKKANV